MRILFLHNRYQLLGGEDVVLSQEADLLRQSGHQVEIVTFSNEGLSADNIWQKLSLGLQTIWSVKGYHLAKTAIYKFKPDLVHIHNFFPQLSPSVYWAAHQAGAPVVQTLHNYRLLCANALLFRNEHPCELCVGRAAPFPALRYKCYRGNLNATLPLFAMQVLHRWIGTFQNKVDAYIALNNFSRNVFVRGGLPPHKIHVKPNFISVSLASFISSPSRKKQFVFVGRLALEKSVDLLLEAWQSITPSDWNLVIVGDGAERASLQSRFPLASVKWMGWLDKQDVLKIVSQSAALVVPSKWYEGAPVVGIEALSVGTPLIAPNHGGFPEMISNGVGWLFQPGSAADLALRLQEAMALDNHSWKRLNRRAREIYEQYYTPEINYRQLMEIYESVLRA